MKIKGLDISRLRNDTHFQFNTEVKTLADAENPTTLGIKQMYDDYAARLQREDEALKKINKSALTQKIHEADRARDKTFSGTVKLVAAMLDHFNPAIADAAARIQVVLDTYGNVAKKPLNEQTSAIYNMLQEFDLPKYTNDRFNTSLNPWLNELKNRNEDFEKLVMERIKEDSLKTDIVLKDARRDVDNAYRAIEERVNAAVVMEGITKYESFVKQLNALIAKYSVKHHHHKPPHPAGAHEDGADENGTNE